jgi:hypothetical protein
MKNKTNVLVDLGIFAAFLAAMEPRMTGEPIHEWLSIALAGTVIVHLLLHWDWILAVGKKYFAKLWHSSRLNFFLDVLLFLAFNAIMISGLMISKTVLPLLGLQAAMGGTWKMVHKLSADIAMWLIAAHIGLHWKWIWDMFKKFVVSPAAKLFAKKETNLVAVKIEADHK